MEELSAAIAKLCAPVYLTSPSPVSETVVNLSDGSGLMSSKLSGCVNAPAEEVCVRGGWRKEKEQRLVALIALSS